MATKTREYTVKGYVKHGLRGAPEYENWHNMKQRCLNPNAPMYKEYGGRGITICSHWLESFMNFYEDMGQRPTPQHSIERIDNDKGYSKENCKWADKTEQLMNRRMNKNNGSGFRGVRTNHKRFQTVVWFDYKNYGFGTHDTKEEAAAVYDQVVMQVYGEIAQTNFDWTNHG